MRRCSFSSFSSFCLFFPVTALSWIVSLWPNNARWVIVHCSVHCVSFIWGHHLTTAEIRIQRSSSVLLYQVTGDNLVETYMGVASSDECETLCKDEVSCNTFFFFQLYSYPSIAIVIIIIIIRSPVLLSPTSAQPAVQSLKVVSSSHRARNKNLAKTA